MAKDFEAPDTPSGETWSALAIKRVTQWQERAYGSLAERSGLGWKPHEMFEHLTATLGRPDLESLREALPTNAFRGEDWEQAEKGVEEYLAAYGEDPATPFSERWLQGTYDYHRAVAEIYISQHEWRLSHRPRMATIPSGDFNARTREIARTGEAAVMFDHTLLAYLHQFALVIAADFPDAWWAMPWPENLAEDGICADTEQAAAQFADLLVSYVVHGHTAQGVVRPELHWRTRSVAAIAAVPMRQFIVCHELAHLLHGHLNVPAKGLSRSELHQREYDADHSGASITAATAPTQAQDVVWLWIADLALTGFQYLDRGLWYLATGVRQQFPASQSHPAPFSRRERLLVGMTDALREADRKVDADRLRKLTLAGNTRVENLWHAAAEQQFTDLHQQGVRPAAVWMDRLAGKGVKWTT